MKVKKNSYPSLHGPVQTEWIKCENFDLPIHEII